MISSSPAVLPQTEALSRPVHLVAVLGAGTMGARIAAHIANSGVDALLLDLPSEGPDRNAIGRKGLETALKSRPAAFFDPASASRVRVGNFEDDLPKLREADWIIEAVVENLQIKHELLRKVSPFVHERAAITTNTSGLPVSAIGSVLPHGLQQRWFGTHFFNPPRYMRLVEVIPAIASERAVMDWIGEFVDRRLGKGLVIAKDTPNFIANRIGTFSVLNVLRVMGEMDLSIEQVDALTGPTLGWPKSATFRTADLVGIDLLTHVIKNSYENLPNDKHRELFRTPPYIEEMIRRGWTGDKAGQGFYKKTRGKEGGSDILALDLKTMEYRPRQKARFPSLDIAKNIDDPIERLRSVAFGRDVAGQFIWTTLSDLFLYSAARLPEIADQPYEIDRAMRWGFNWQMGPFEMWDALGLEATVARMHKEGREIPDYVTRLLGSGAKAFYRWAPAAKAGAQANGSTSGGTPTRLEAVSPQTLKYEPVQQPLGILKLDAVRKTIGEARRSSGCSLLDLGDGVGCLEFHSKMNAIGADIVQMVTATVREAESRFEAFVVANEGENFSVGANLVLLLLEIQEENWDDVDLAIRAFQGMNMAIKRSQRPVVAAPFNLTLGGGCELMLHAPRVTAHAELYSGLVEVGVGLIPAGGGTKEMAIRAVSAAEALRGPGSRGESVEVQEAMKAAFELIGMAKVSTSAVESRKLGFLRSSDIIIANRDRLLSSAKAEALHMLDEGYEPAPPVTIPAPGFNVRATLQLGAYLMRQAEYITEHEQKIANKLAHVLSGGDVATGTPITEEYLLDLEREAFLSLCGERKTQERIQYTLKTGKTLRN